MTARPLRSRLAVAFASFGYVGFAPVAPGTVGSAAAIPFFLLLRLAHSAWLEIAVCAAIVVAGAWSARITEQALGVEDPGPVVIDEVVGMFVSLLFLPATWLVVLAGFVAFRVFDIVKPWPARPVRSTFREAGASWPTTSWPASTRISRVQVLLWARPGLLT